MIPARVRLGSWTCPSGNSVDVFVGEPLADRVARLRFEWETPPPLPPADEIFYRGVILPEVQARFAEFQERPVGRGLVVRQSRP
jgi:hypothetical protein